MRDQVYTPELIAAAIEGDDSSLSFLYNSTQDKVTQTVRSMIRDEDAVLDIVQDSFIKGFRSLDKLDDPKYFLAWMRRIATNTAVDYLKKKKPVLFSELAGEDGMEIEFEDENIGHMPDVLLDQKETSRLIQEIVSGLSDEQQLAIGLFYFEDMSIKSIAEKLGCSENTVKSRLNYGRKNIEKQVLELEKKGTKLYSLAPVPFFLWLLRSMHTEPSRDMLGAVLAECRCLASGVSATASHVAAQVGSQVAKKAARGAAKKLAVKIAAGILAAVTVGGAAVAVSNANEEPSTYRRPSHSETRGSEPTEEVSTDATEPDTTPTVPEVDPTPAYQVILDEFTAACNDTDYLSHRERYPNTDIEAMVNYHTFGAFNLYYAYHDLDGNGVDELLIGDGSVLGVYAFDGTQAVSLIHEPNIGWRTSLTVMQTGELYVSGSSGADMGDDYMVRLAADGYSTEVVFYYAYTGDLYQGIYENRVSSLKYNEFEILIASYQELTVDWHPLRESSEPQNEDYGPIPDAHPSDVMYNGQYIPIPFTLEAFVKDGWFFSTNDPEGYIVLRNDRYPEVVLTLYDERYLNCNLEAVQGEVYGICFGMNPECQVYPEINFKDSFGFKSTRADVEKALGTPVSEEGYNINGMYHEFLSFISSYDGYTLNYNITLADDAVTDITVTIVIVAPDEAIDVQLEKAKVGDVVYFGEYVFPDESKAMPIQWVVLEKENGKAFLITKNSVAHKQFNNAEYQTAYVHKTWEFSDIRRWLNYDFYNDAFNKKEKLRIVESNITNYSYSEKANDCRNTNDRIFLLSVGEAEAYRYLDCIGMFADFSKCWLRSPGIDDYAPSNMDYGDNIDYNGSLSSYEMDIYPCTWVTYGNDEKP